MNSIPIKKNTEYIVDVIDNGFEGEGISKIENFTIFIPGAIKGEKVKILIVKVLSSYAYGKIIEIIKKDENRVEPDCLTYKRCGGCNLRHIAYKETLKIKKNAVEALAQKMLKNKINIKDVIPMENSLYYRNKAQYPVGLNKNNEPIIGVYANRTHEIIQIEKCYIQKDITKQISDEILSFVKKHNITVYDEKTQKGLIRHIVIKVGVKTNEIMCVIVINGERLGDEKTENELAQMLISKFPNIKTIVKNVNMKNTNVILGSKNINLYGNGYINDILGDYIFKISPLSFYQVNPIQVEKLYDLAVKLADIKGEDVVFDLYCGIGTISIYMSKYAKKVYGVEIVEQAIEDAKENARINNVENIDFICGDVEIVLDDLINNKKISPDIVMVDPPRKGLDNKSIENLLKIKPKKIVYISCNPATLMRDLSKLEDFYEFSEINPVDMFPFTSHTENIAILKLR